MKQRLVVDRTALPGVAKAPVLHPKCLTTLLPKNITTKVVALYVLDQTYIASVHPPYPDPTAEMT